jgi:hypothetical protein
MTVITVDLPPMYFPMPFRCHPQVETLERRGIHWMTRNGLCPTPQARDRAAETASALCFASYCPDADLDRLQLAVDWTYLMFAFDDACCDEESPSDAFSFLDIAVRIVRTLESPAAEVLDPAHPFARPTLDLAQRLHELASPTQRRRLTDAHRAWFTGVAWTRAASQSDYVPDLNEYLFTRMLSVAVHPVLAWFEVTEPEDIPDVAADSPVVRALSEMAGMAAGIDDDLFSYGKDLWFARRQQPACDPFVSNIVDVIIHQAGLSRDEALLAAADLRNQIVARFVEVRDQIADPSPPLARYLSNLTSLIRGNYEWGMTADRYTNPDGRHPGAVHLTGQVTGVAPHGAPPSIGSIAWWWNDLPVLDVTGPGGTGKVAAYVLRVLDSVGCLSRPVFRADRDEVRPAAYIRPSDADPVRIPRL